MKLDGVKCMLFDLDGTLIDSMVYWRALTARVRRMRLAVREVALCAGFCNMAYFYGRFAKKYGTSPKQYRETKKQK